MSESSSRVSLRLFCRRASCLWHASMRCWMSMLGVLVVGCVEGVDCVSDVVHGVSNVVGGLSAVEFVACKLVELVPDAPKLLFVANHCSLGVRGECSIMRRCLFVKCRCCLSMCLRVWRRHVFQGAVATWVAAVWRPRPQVFAVCTSAPCSRRPH